MITPVYMGLGGRPSYEIGYITDPSELPDLLRAAADELSRAASSMTPSPRTDPPLKHGDLAWVRGPYGPSTATLARFNDWSDEDDEPDYRKTLRYWTYFGSDLSDPESSVEVVHRVHLEAPAIPADASRR